jgi:ubiquitin carboxyl-terminal hydrolase L5
VADAGGTGFDLGPTLSEFKGFTKDFSTEIKGLCVGNSANIREAHNSFARAEPFMMEESKAATDKDDVFHFIAYVPRGGRVYELDGLKNGPIDLGGFGPSSEDAAAGAAVGGGGAKSWLDVARTAVQSRIDRYTSSEIRFNLMGLVKNKKDGFLEKKAALERLLAALLAADGGAAAMEDVAAGAGYGNEAVAADPAGRAAQRAEAEAALADCAQGVQAEEEKFATWRMENVRRKHNYIPFVVNLLRILAERNHLQGLLTKAQSSRRE